MFHVVHDSLTRKHGHITGPKPGNWSLYICGIIHGLLCSTWYTTHWEVHSTVGHYIFAASFTVILANYTEAQWSTEAHCSDQSCQGQSFKHAGELDAFKWRKSIISLVLALCTRTYKCHAHPGLFVVSPLVRLSSSSCHTEPAEDETFFVRKRERCNG